MKYFRVEKKTMRTPPVASPVSADGLELGDKCDVPKIYEVCIGFTVYELDETGMTQNVEFYPVSIDTSTFIDNSEEVLEEIRVHYSANNGWQNNEW